MDRPFCRGPCLPLIQGRFCWRCRRGKWGKTFLRASRRREEERRLAAGEEIGIGFRQQVGPGADAYFGLRRDASFGVDELVFGKSERRKVRKGPHSFVRIQRSSGAPPLLDWQVSDNWGTRGGLCAGCTERYETSMMLLAPREEWSWILVMGVPPRARHRSASPVFQYPPTLRPPEGRFLPVGRDPAQTTTSSAFTRSLFFSFSRAAVTLLSMSSSRNLTSATSIAALAALANAAWEVRRAGGGKAENCSMGSRRRGGGGFSSAEVAAGAEEEEGVGADVLVRFRRVDEDGSFEEGIEEGGRTGEGPRERVKVVGGSGLASEDWEEEMVLNRSDWIVVSSFRNPGVASPAQDETARVDAHRD